MFDQEAGKDNADLTPLIEFLDFINNADDATFNAELPDRLDVDSFATYLAMEELLGNFDDIDGPGNNSYLYYDPRPACSRWCPGTTTWPSADGEHGRTGGRRGEGHAGGRRPGLHSRG